jgi:hypothetical protein
MNEQVIEERFNTLEHQSQVKHITNQSRLDFGRHNG